MTPNTKLSIRFSSLERGAKLPPPTELAVTVSADNFFSTSAALIPTTCITVPFTIALSAICKTTVPFFLPKAITGSPSTSTPSGRPSTFNCTSSPKPPAGINETAILTFSPTTAIAVGAVFNSNPRSSSLTCNS